MTTAKEKKKGCAVYRFENGQVNKRWVSTLAINWPGLANRAYLGNELPKSVILNAGPNPVDVSVREAFQSRESVPRSIKKDEKRCAVFFVEKGRLKLGSINELIINWSGQGSKRLSGNQLPKVIFLNTGEDPADDSTLDIVLSRETYRSTTKYVKKPELPLGPVAAIAALTFLGFKVVFALVEAFASPVF